MCASACVFRFIRHIENTDLARKVLYALNVQQTLHSYKQFIYFGRCVCVCVYMCLRQHHSNGRTMVLDGAFFFIISVAPRDREMGQQNAAIVEAFRHTYF